jgi:hypothetical protein
MIIDKQIGKYAGMTIFQMKEKHPICKHVMAYYHNTIIDHPNLACIEPSCNFYWKSQIDCDVEEQEQSERWMKD